jgi:hypothetical protein
MKAGKKNSSCIEEQARGPVDSNTFVRVMGRKTFRTGRRSLLHLSQGGKKRAIQLSCAGSVHLGFDHELVARFPDGALRRQLPNSVPDGPGIRAVDVCLELEFHLVFLRLRSGNATAQEAWGQSY